MTVSRVLVLDDHASSEQTRRDYNYFLQILSDKAKRVYRPKWIDTRADVYDLISQASIDAEIVFIDYVWEEDGVSYEEGLDFLSSIHAIAPDILKILITRQDPMPSNLQVAATSEGALLATSYGGFFKSKTTSAEMILGRRSKTPGRRLANPVDVDLEVLVVDIAESSTFAHSEQVVQINDVVRAIDFACEKQNCQEPVFQFTGDGYILCWKNPAPMLAASIAIDLFEYLGPPGTANTEVRILVNSGKSIEVRTEGGSVQFVGDAVSSACHCLSTVSETGVYVTQPYYASRFSGGRQPEGFSFGEFTTIQLKHGRSATIARMGRAGEVAPLIQSK